MPPMRRAGSASPRLSPPPPPPRAGTVGPESPVPSPLGIFESPVASSSDRPPVRRSPRRELNLDELKTQAALVKAQLDLKNQQLKAQAAERKITKAAQQAANKQQREHAKASKKIDKAVKAQLAKGRKAKADDVHGSNKWNTAQTEWLLDTLQIILPAGPKSWGLVTDAHQQHIDSCPLLDWPDRTKDNLKKKWGHLKDQLSKGKPTGNPERPGIIMRIKEVNDAIEAKYQSEQMGGISTDSFESEESDDERLPATLRGPEGKRPETPELESGDDLDPSGVEVLAARGNNLSKLKAAQSKASAGNWRADHGGQGSSSTGPKTAKGALAAAAGALECIAGKSSDTSPSSMMAMMMMQMRDSDQKREDRDRQDRLDREQRQEKVDAERHMQMEMANERHAAMIQRLLQPTIVSPLPELTPPGRGIVNLVTPDVSPATAEGGGGRKRKALFSPSPGIKKERPSPRSAPAP